MREGKVEFRCDTCEKLLRTDASHIGDETACPSCGAALVVPDYEPAFADDTAEPLEHAGFDQAPETAWHQQTSDPAAPVNRSASSNAGRLKPHRGVAVLILGIFSWFTGIPFLAVAGVVMGASDLKAMDRGTMDPSGRDMTRWGYWIGLAHLILVGVILVLVCGGVLVAIIA
ncbi:hypothetical protein [Stratiformator vulcanicus]|uniref:DUF4190 domain-containing protein n=1 Tax=Stratiformator vulcanicus TaxID=2527980 RepID=A0A517R4T4_9PLAN|nr:hypothetical protein [Stratiformator vulcanicus]QDT38885.1 hypothetical protein Pan189_32840 [Stratiformator vulcanicus]